MPTALTPFGSACRQHRAKRELVMQNQAKALRCSVAYISAIERGIRPVPEALPSAFAEWLQLSGHETSELERLARSIDVTTAESEARGSVQELVEKVRTLRANLSSGSTRVFREREIRQLAVLAREAFGLSSQIAVDILSIVENKLAIVDPEYLLQVEADSWHGDEFKANTHVENGLAKTIVVSEAIYKGAASDNSHDREKLGHELAHVMLHGKRSHSFYRLAKSSKVEAEANLFARVFLVPDVLAVRYSNPSTLARDAGVSLKTAEMRMREVGAWPPREEKERVKKGFSDLLSALKGTSPLNKTAQIIPFRTERSSATAGRDSLDKAFSLLRSIKAS